MTFVVLAANPKPQSRTLSIARLAADAVSRAAGLDGGHQVVDLSGLARLLLLELGAVTPAPGLAVLESDLGHPGAVLDPWAVRVAAALDRFAALTHGAAAGEPARPVSPELAR